MRLGFRFSNLLGSVYGKGNVIFSPKDGNKLFSPVGNRVTCFHLLEHTAHTLPIESRKNISVMALSPDGRLLLLIDEDGRCLVVSTESQIALHRFNFKKPVRAVAFSPCGNFLAVTMDRKIQVWRSPGLRRDFTAFSLVKECRGHTDTVTCLRWSADSSFILSGSKDRTVRISASTNNHAAARRKRLRLPSSITLSGHREPIVGCFWTHAREDDLTAGPKAPMSVCSVSRDGAVFLWDRVPDNTTDSSPSDGASSSSSESDNYEAGQRYLSLLDMLKGGAWTLRKKKFIHHDRAKIASTAFNDQQKILLLGFSSGVFGIYRLPQCQQIHTLSVSQNKINAAAINPSGAWLALGSSRLGQLLVWEWQSETYVMKQQGHEHGLRCLAYSPDGATIATGGEDGKIKLWNTSSGFCFVTFTQHSNAVTGLHFIGTTGHALVSSSLDGTARAFDLIRYRNFRVLTPTATSNSSGAGVPGATAQLISVGVDSAGEIVAAGALEPFHIFLWSLQTGKLIEVLAGHEGPVCCVEFSPARPVLASGSWDKTVRVWALYQNNSTPEVLTHTADVLAIAFRPDGKELCASTLNGKIQRWDVDNAHTAGEISGRRDIAGGRRIGDFISSKKSSAGKCFTSVCYTADGACILAGGKSKYVCLYHAGERLMLRKWQLSHNRSMDGVLDELHSKDLTEGGFPIQDIQDSSDDDSSHDADNPSSTAKFFDTLPGAKVDKSKRNVRPTVQSFCVRFSPSGRSWAAATTEGILVYALDVSQTFEPLGLSRNTTPKTIRAALANREYSKALTMSLRLNIKELIQESFFSVPISTIPLVVRAIPKSFLHMFLEFVAAQLHTSPHLEFALQWSLAALQTHGLYIQTHSRRFAPVFRHLQKCMASQLADLTQLTQSNTYTLQFIHQQPAAAVNTLEK